MHTGSELVETWIPVEGFRTERRESPNSGRRRDLVPRWDIGELDLDQPCARQPCLHRIVVDCLPERAPIVDLAGRYGLLTVSLTRIPELGEPVPVSALTPEPLDIWRREIRELKAAGDLWDWIAAGDRRGEEMLERKLAAGLARAPFHLSAARENGSGFRMRYRPATLRTVLWQRLAGEVAGFIHCTRCPAPSCGRWFLTGEASRSDRLFCSDICRIRAYRGKLQSPTPNRHVTPWSGPPDREPRCVS